MPTQAFTCTKLGKNLHGFIKTLLAEKVEGKEVLYVVNLLSLLTIWIIFHFLHTYKLTNIKNLWASYMRGKHPRELTGSLSCVESRKKKSDSLQVNTDGICLCLLCHWDSFRSSRLSLATCIPAPSQQMSAHSFVFSNFFSSQHSKCN